MWEVMGMDSPDDYPQWMEENFIPGAAKVTHYSGSPTSDSPAVLDGDDIEPWLVDLVFVRCAEHPLPVAIAENELSVIMECADLLDGFTEGLATWPCPGCMQPNVQYAVLLSRAEKEKLLQAAELLGCPSTLEHVAQRMGRTPEWIKGAKYERVALLGVEAWQLVH